MQHCCIYVWLDRLLLPVWSTVAVAGVQNMSTILSRAGELTECDFLGCLRGVSLYGQDLLSNSAGTAVSGTCTRRPSGGLCVPNPCLNAGVCVDEWTDYRCQCASGYAGSNCANGSNVTTHN